MSGHAALTHHRYAGILPSQLLAGGYSLKATEFMDLARHQSGRRNHNCEDDEVLGSPPLRHGSKDEDHPTTALEQDTLGQVLPPESYFVGIFPRVNTSS